MRLINASNRKFECFADDRVIPEYAILSHKWGGGEVSYADMINGDCSKSGGFRKIEFCRQQALVQKHTHAWIDTCCLDKNSSAEIEETINSMYRLYQNSKVCYAYLHDVDVKSMEHNMSQSPKASGLLRG